MGLWLILGAMTVLAAALVAWPLLRPPRERLGRGDYDLRVYRAQLEEVARERERGLLGAREAEAAKLEVERRMLATDARSREARARRNGAPAAAGRPRWAPAAALLIVLSLLAAGLYWRLGRPDLPSVPFAGRAGNGEAAQPGQPARGRAQQGALPSVETLIARLEQRLAQTPDDLEGWLRLGQAYELTEQFEQAVGAYRHALTLDDGSARLHASLGEALVMASGGIVTPAADQAFGRALERDPTDPRARFYRGLALLQRGEQRAALDAWIALIERSPGDAPWLPELRRRATGLAEGLGLEPDEVLPPSPGPVAAPRDGGTPGPSAEQMQAARDMSAEERATMVRSMVEGLEARLEAQPDDIEGWRMLGRSYQVLGEPAKSADAYRRVAEARPDDLGAQLDYARALVALVGDGQPVSPALAAQMSRVLALDAQNPSALYYLGKAAAEAGDTAGASAHWQRLLALLPPGSPERAEIQRLVDALRAPVREP